MVRLLEINGTVSHCESCVYCTWLTDDLHNTGWFCNNAKSNYRLILTKEDYDSSGLKHVFIPEWCPLLDPAKFKCPTCSKVAPFFRCKECGMVDARAYDFRFE